MTQFSAPQGYGAPQYQQPAPQQMPQQYGQPQPDLQAMMYGQQQAYAAPPVQPQYQQPAPQQNGHTGGFFTQQDPHLQAQQSAAQPQFQGGPVDTSSFFGGAASISWDHTKGYAKGTYRGGQITDKKIVPQTELGTNKIRVWGDGSPRTQMVLTLQTAERVDPQDNGQRQMFLKGDAPRAAREAFQKIGAKDLELGGWYYQAWVDEKAAKQAGYNPQKIFAAIYAPPGSPDPMAGQAAFTPQPSVAPPQNYPNPAEQVLGASVVNGIPQPHATPDQFAAYAAMQANQQAAYAQPAQPQQFPQGQLQYQQPTPGPAAQMPQQTMANFQQAAAGMPGQPQQYGQPVPYGAMPGDLSAQQNGQQPAAAPGADWNPFGPQG